MFLRVIRGAVMAAVVVTLASFAVMSLWNVLIPAIFAAKAISFWQALGLLVLSKILFGGFRSPMGRARWRGRMNDRWRQMTPEERGKFKRGMRGCGFGQNAESPEAKVSA